MSCATKSRSKMAVSCSRIIPIIIRCGYRISVPLKSISWIPGNHRPELENLEYRRPGLHWPTPLPLTGSGSPDCRWSRMECVSPEPFFLYLPDWHFRKCNSLMHGTCLLTAYAYLKRGIIGRLRSCFSTGFG